jgi:2-polyprenyl-6-methoxyphenol hydroxylase-like FAD-dependent oxidoreductase
VGAPRPITIVGGGLAGLSLGLALRQRSIPVTIFEAGHYPRHRVCGEFISGQGLRALDQLGLTAKLTAAGAVSAQTTVFYLAHRQTRPKQLPHSALCLSRFVLDDLLAGEFQSSGGDLKQDSRWDQPSHPGVVRASGRRPNPTDNGWRYFGLKAHACGVKLTADLEMHFVDNGYVGLCRLAGDRVNVCGLFRRKTGNGGRAGFELLRGAEGTHLGNRLRGARFDEASFCSVAGLSLRPKRASAQPECCIGDALTMIPPVTGNGMSVALESARLALDPLVDYSEGRVEWNVTKKKIADACDKKFLPRLRWAHWLQQALFWAPSQRLLLSAIELRADFWPTLFAKTRQ